MGLDMYLKRANLHGYTPRNAEVANSYYSFVKHNQENPEDACKSMWDWCSATDDELDLEAFEALRSEYQPRYFDFDVDKLFPMPDIFEQVGYWRKANAIHGWFVRNVQNDVDDCGTYIVTKEQLEELKILCESVLSGKVKGKKVLPTQPGFFFGSYEYDEDYMDDLRNTIEIIDKVIAETNWEVESVCYQASW